MNKEEIKKFIIKIISSSPELREDFLILLKNKTGHMKNIILEGCARTKPDHLENLKYYMANSDEAVRHIYTNHMNFRIKSILKRSSGIRVNDEAFRAIMSEVVDDLADSRGST